MRRLLVILACAAVLLSVTSCKFFDSLLYSAPSVSASDLATYSGSLPQTRDQAMTAIGMGGMGTFIYIVEYLASSPEVQAAFPTAQALTPLSAIPSFELLSPMFNKLGSKSISISQSGMDNDDLDKEIHVDIEDETVDLPVGVTGTVKIEKTKVDLSASMSSASAPYDGEGNAEADIQVSASKLDVYGDSSLTVNTAKVGVKAKVSSTWHVGTAGPTSIAYDVSASAKAGFSITSAVDNTSGKFIIETSYYDSGDLSESELEDPMTGISNVEFTITISVYNNSDDLVDTYTLDQDDLADYINAQMP